MDVKAIWGIVKKIEIDTILAEPAWHKLEKGSQHNLRNLQKCLLLQILTCYVADSSPHPIFIFISSLPLSESSQAPVSIYWLVLNSCKISQASDGEREGRGKKASDRRKSLKFKSYHDYNHIQIKYS